MTTLKKVSGICLVVLWCLMGTVFIADIVGSRTDAAQSRQRYRALQASEIRGNNAANEDTAAGASMALYPPCLSCDEGVLVPLNPYTDGTAMARNWACTKSSCGFFIGTTSSIGASAFTTTPTWPFSRSGVISESVVSLPSDAQKGHSPECPFSFSSHLFGGQWGAGPCDGKRDEPPRLLPKVPGATQNPTEGIVFGGRPDRVSDSLDITARIISATQSHFKVIPFCGRKAQWVVLAPPWSRWSHSRSEPAPSP